MSCNRYEPIDLGVDEVFNITEGNCAAQADAYAERLAAEALEISGAPINVFRLLGIHEQGQLIDLTGSGNAISGGTSPASLHDWAFNDGVEFWESFQWGPDVISAPAFIGYNFGTRKTLDGREGYASPQPVLQHITTISIKQGANIENRVLQARVERSDDGGVTWKRVDVVNLPDTSAVETINLRASAPSQIWRIVPLIFNGGATDKWIVEELEFMDYQATSLDNIQDPIFMENRDRDYANLSIRLKTQYDLVDVQTELTKFGIDIPTQYYFTISFARMVELLGRPIVIGDIIEVPNEKQYDHNLNCVQKWLEVTDATWSTEGYTPGWKPILYRVTAQPLLASQENRDVMGTSSSWEAITDDAFLADALHVDNQAQKTDELIAKDSEERVPETGSNMLDIEEQVYNPVTNELVHNVSHADIYAEDGIPPNGQPYTEDQSFPLTPNDGDYHRLTYPTDYDVPTKLFQWSAVKNRWIYLETDRRLEQSAHRPTVAKILQSSTSVPLSGDE